MRATNSHRILFLSAQVGAGHMSAAGAVQKALLELNPSLEIAIVDSYSHASRLFGKVAAQGYIQMVKFLPQLYSFIYDLRERDSTMSLIKSRLIQRTAKNFRKLIKEYNPDVIVCTHAFPSGIASLLKEEFSIPLVSVVTDFTVHPFWINANTDLYIVGTQELKEILQKRGVASNKIKVTGIPVDPSFVKNGKKQESRARLGLDQALPTILIMGGGAGLGPLAWILRALRKLKHAVQVIVVTGINRSLRKRIENYAKKLNGRSHKKTSLRNIKIYGFVENIHELMNASDLLITKPGGLTSSEALASELPLVIVRPLPGQEVRNAQFLIKEKAAILVKREKYVAGTIDSLFDNPQTMEELRERAKELKKPNAAYEAAKSILSLIS